MTEPALPLRDEAMSEAEIFSEVFPAEAGERRRLKAALLLGAVWFGVLALHAYQGQKLVLGVAVVLGMYALRLVSAKPEAIAPVPGAELPKISVLVSAHNEVAVVEQLAANLAHLDYPIELYELWVIDDRSTDGTSALLDELADRYPQLRVLHRIQGGGGKSGALNQVLPLTQGEIIGVFDADAQVSPDCLQTLGAYFADPQVGAVQLRKAIVNDGFNWLTTGQALEMSLDAHLQRQRIALGGIGELRGNGQFVRRRALKDCGGWNEDTITDDLDLTLRLHLRGWKIDLAPWPTAGEEGVTSLKSLWPQRTRWAEGGYQRYLDYWRSILTGQAGSKTWDLLVFALMQYLLPTAALPDFVGAAWYHQSPLLWPLTALGLAIQVWSLVGGSRWLYPHTSLVALLPQLVLGTLYLLHWIVVMPIVTFRMAIYPKQLKWVKTPRQGDSAP
jgi:1,2-diacylglycerol 3-beta-glucosyltransferase